MAYKKAISAKSRETKVSNVFINEYMPDANGNFVKVYLLGLSQCALEKPMSLSEMADKLCLLESDVVRVWQYWADKKVVFFDGENVEFADLDAKRRAALVETKPVYSAEEIFACSAANKQLGDMLRIVEKILQKPLSSTDLTVLYSLYDYYRLPLDIIPMLVTFCVNNGKKSMRQIEKTASSWLEKGIDSVESAERYLKKAEEYSRAVDRLKNAMGANDVRFSPNDLKYINSWLIDMKLPFELIMKAYDACIANTGELSIAYMNKILVNRRATSAGHSEQKSKAKPTNFTNFDQPEYDFDAFERRSIGGADKK